ncbi:XdhC family protein [Salsuginibacillus kocurii]|uniref:XdhC family protein n=1 Tax=Salsuginibacillus kocurii TaxID=427078 RepID=UPI0003742F43|nr:XdhC family protein [Salsuginibacillus kocurii]
MESIHEILEELAKTKEKAALATIVHVEGSAYRKEGTAMLIKQDGSTVGLLSAGCLEEDVVARTEDVINNGPCLVTFDMKEEHDLAWGAGAGCNGEVQVLVEPIDAAYRHYLLTLKSYLDRNQPVLMSKKMTEADPGISCWFSTLEGEAFGRWQGSLPDRQLECKITEIRSGLHQQYGSTAPLYIHCFRPKPKLTVFGAGPDARPLVSFAAKAGFSVTVADWRPALCTKEHFPEADQLVIGFPEEIREQLSFSETEACVVLTHHFMKDQELLMFLVDEPLYYLAVLGSRDRTARLLGTDEFPSHLKTPAGLDIGAEGPEQIAISIVGQLIESTASNKTTAEVVAS